MMVDVIRQMLVELQRDRAACLLKAFEADESISCGQLNAFVELAFRQTRDDASSRVVMLGYKIQALEELIERIKDNAE